MMLALLPGRVKERAAREIARRERSASAPDTHGGRRANVWQPQIAPAFSGIVKALLSWIAAFAGICLLGTTAARATVSVYSNDKLSVGLGGLLQLRFKDDHPIGGNSEQEFLVQCLRLEF
ncbi:MAG TPA: hypothetical protein VFX38_08820, partial [Gammaproteobacteria bacterium]|nr:hypothetical protein [Gammaproteobacteria bacterium]